MKRTRNVWTNAEQSQLLHRVGELLGRGYPLAEAIESAALHLSVEKKKIMSHCIRRLREGSPMHLILADLNFAPSLTGYVYFAEQHGGLADAFREGGKILQKREDDFAKLKKLLMYPIFLLFFTFTLFIFVDHFLLPRFSSLFTSLNIQQNFFTVIVNFFGDLMPILTFLFLGVLLYIFYYFYFRFRHYTSRKQKEIIVSIPLIGEWLTLLYTHYFAVQLHYLLAAGMSVTEALDIFGKNDRQPLYKEIGQEIYLALKRGERLEDVISAYNFFSSEMRHVIVHGQKNGKLEQELYFFSKYCLENLEAKIERALKIIQPLIYSFIGFLIVSMYLAVLLPMFHLLEGI